MEIRINRKNYEISMSNTRCFTDGPCLAVITGASRGLGRAIAHQLYRHLAAGSTLILTARDSVQLQETRAQLLASGTDGEVAGEAASRPPHQIVCITADLSSVDCSKQLDQLVSTAEAIALPPSGQYANYRPLHSAIMVHNAGALGDVSLTADKHCSLVDLDEFFRLSLSSTIALNSRLIQALRPHCREELIVVNISSLCAIKPYRSMSLYCCAKAARDAFFAVLAAETSQSSSSSGSGGGDDGSSGRQTADESQSSLSPCSIDVLSYAPGPLVTDMTRFVAENSADAEIREHFTKGRQSVFLTCEQSAVRMMDVLKAKRYRSGQHVDYYDTE